MKKHFLYLLLFFSMGTRAQVFNGETGPITNPGTYIFTISVTGLASQLDSIYGLVSIGINITHPAVEQLHIYMRSPAGIQVELTGTKSCKGSGFVNTTLKNNETLSIASASAPYSGTFSPLGNLGRFNNQKTGNGTWQLFIEHLAPASFTGAVNGWSLTFGPAPPKPVLLTSSNLPLVFINTPGGVGLTESDMLVSLGVTYNGTSRNYAADAKNNYDGEAICHVRGSSSRMFEKKNLKLELKNNSGNLDTNVSLVGMPSESDWILTACYTDKTLIRNSFSQDLFRQMGHYTPRYRFVELVLNDEYFGVYMLMEQVKRGSSRVNISKTKSSASQFPEITGGYIVQVDRTDSPGWYSAFPGVSANGAKFYYQYNYPNPDVITLPQQDYLKAVLDSFENVMASPNFTSVQNGFRRFIDEESFIDYLILQEISKNVDAYKLSTFLYKDNIIEGGKWHAGPVWDFDLAWHNANYGNAFSPDEWQHVQNNSSNPIPTWWRRFLEDAMFNDKLQCRYKSLRQTVFSHDEMFSYIDGQAEELKEARERNFRQFPIMGAYVWPDPQQQAGASYETEIADLKNWIINRTAWLDVNVPGQCFGLGLSSHQTEDGMSVYPNPFSDFFSVIVSAGSRLRLFDMTGNCIKEISVSMEKTEVNVQGLPNGIYLLEVKDQNGIFLRKVIRQATP